MEALLERMQNQGHGGRGFLTSCEAELQELMKQIDIMVAHKKSEWEGQTQALETCLEIRDHELSSVKTLLAEKHKEVGRLRQQLEHTEQDKQGMAVEYEQQLKKFQEELGRLKRSYEKLQKKQLKEAREGPKCQGDDRSEVSRLTKKIEEFRQKSLDWEKQRLLYQQQVASLEAQRKALAEQSELIQQTQLTNRKQVLESVQLASQSEIQHLTSKLERANDTICANELEVERLNMRVDDLTGASQKILEDHQRVQEELGHSKKMLEVLQEEKLELRVTLQSQEDFIKSSKMHQEQLQKELASITETLHSKELLIRSLEEHLHEKQLSQEFPELEHVLLQLDLAQKNEKNLQSEVARLEGSLGAINARCIQLSKEQMEKCKELRVMEEHHCQAKAEIKKLKEQLSQAEQTHNSELEGMKKEISQLTQALHQRDIAIASASGSTSDMEQRMRMEIERIERKAVEHRVILVQLETLRLENRHLSEMLQKVESSVLGAKDVPVTDIQESYTTALNKLESENQQLQKDLAETRAKLEFSTQACRDKYESIVQQMQSKVTEIKDTECRRTQELQHKHEEERRKLQARLEKTIQHYKGEIQTLKAQHVSPGMGAVSGAAGGLSPHISRSSSKESLSSDSLLGADPLPPVLDGKQDFTDDASRESVSSQQRELVPLCPLPTAPIGSIAARFLEEEEVRSQHILERLDAHIEELKRESERTVKQFTRQK
ncbi:centrosomal protein of 63 kDa isoform X6 [Trachemys scripta elegans]|nr:centrosomal protein of 63 kDa isoform X6 [Trachemys scripta elegans]XP_034636722.1 centrosomal protein of 63 kDa isoform X6 [Trachemys scripta elegans]XP_034636723.1 centrosomal protein of 63 kDa isoform X6 [Trachemys scripta elegans]XP_034636724.1 centrosomal protein of 63 kDa isoform X6 [Trachemys scripta elegans]XP_034636725.1 centrosomal protein of 63 kDa isoform X6 [Trachemys scripta elegans]XP_034636726.1 centrosomal protein of 63 kDa isoform X6 [Trachemys scripta elegans]XP_03463672